MDDLDFFCASEAMSLGAIAAEGHAELPASADATRLFRTLASLNLAGPDDVAFFFQGDDCDDLIATRAGVCFVTPDHRTNVPSNTIALVTENPLDAFLRVASVVHPDAVKAGSLLQRTDIDPSAIVHGDARLEQGVTIDPGAVVGPRAEIGTGTRIGSDSIIGFGVRIGRHCTIDAHVVIRNAFLGDRVVIGAGARIGLDGPDLQRPVIGRIPRLGRVIVQDEVEIGANSVIDRGYAGDTMLGDRARIGPLTFVRGGTTIDRGLSVEAGGFSSAPKIV